MTAAKAGPRPLGGTGRPTSGTRYVVELDEGESSPAEAIYRGFIHLAEADLPLLVRVERPGGATRADLGRDVSTGAPFDELERMAAALVRSATKAPVAAGAALPRKIVRWRG